MHRPNRFVTVGNAFTQSFDEVAVQLWYGIANCVRHVDGAGAFINNSFENAAKKIHIAAIAVFWTEFNIAHQIACKARRLLRLLKNLIRRHAQLLFHVQCTGGKKNMNTRIGGALQSLCSARDIAVIGTG